MAGEPVPRWPSATVRRFALNTLTSVLDRFTFTAMLLIPGDGPQLAATAICPATRAQRAAEEYSTAPLGTPPRLYRTAFNRTAD